MRGIGRGFDRGEARVRDRRRRQADVGARVVGRVDVQLGFGEFVGVGSDALLELHRVVQGGIDPERHAEPQPVVDHRRDLRPVARDQCLALDHRGDDQQLVGGHVQGVRTGDDARGEVFVEGGELIAHEPADRRPRVLVVGGREQEAFEVGGVGGCAVVRGVEQRRTPRRQPVVAPKSVVRCDLGDLGAGSRPRGSAPSPRPGPPPAWLPRPSASGSAGPPPRRPRAAPPPPRGAPRASVFPGGRLTHASVRQGCDALLVPAGPCAARRRRAPRAGPAKQRDRVPVRSPGSHPARSPSPARAPARGRSGVPARAPAAPPARARSRARARAPAPARAPSRARARAPAQPRAQARADARKRRRSAEGPPARTREPDPGGRASRSRRSAWCRSAPGAARRVRAHARRADRVRLPRRRRPGTSRPRTRRRPRRRRPRASRPRTRRPLTRRHRARAGRGRGRRCARSASGSVRRSGSIALSGSIASAGLPPVRLARRRARSSRSRSRSSAERSRPCRDRSPRDKTRDPNAIGRPASSRAGGRPPANPRWR